MAISSQSLPKSPKRFQLFGAFRLPKPFKNKFENDAKSSPKSSQIDVWRGLSGTWKPLEGLVDVLGTFWGSGGHLDTSWSCLRVVLGSFGIVLERFIGRHGADWGM